MEHIVSLTPAAGPDPIAMLAAPPAPATLVEIRADLFPGLDLRSAVRACPLPVVLTLRSTLEGGRGPDDAKERRSILESGYQAGAHLLDLEFDRDLPTMRRLGIEPQRVVLSWHHPSDTPGTLEQQCAAMVETPARWIKVVPTAHSLADLTAVLALHRRFNPQRRHARRVISFAMGTVGIASRFLAPLLGPPLAYVAWSSDSAAAPGQLTAEQLDAVTSHLAGMPKRVYGVVGADVSSSLSPVLHSAAYRACDMPYLFLPLSVAEPEELPALFAPRGEGLLARAGLDIRGLAVTTPYKEQAAEAANLQAPRVRTAGAANTLLLRPSQIVAENTDADGVVGALTTFGIDCRGKVAVVQGTGGAARGAAVGLHLAGASVTLRGRDSAISREQARRLRIGWCGPEEIPPDAEILVNATPLGSLPTDASPFTAGEVGDSATVVDMVYAPHATALARLADRSGVPLVDGHEILAHQGFAQFAAFTGRMAPREAMRAALTGYRPGE